jgi:hypothetical protein
VRRTLLALLLLVLGAVAYANVPVVIPQVPTPGPALVPRSAAPVVIGGGDSGGGAPPASTGCLVNSSLVNDCEVNG